MESGRSRLCSRSAHDLGLDGKLRVDPIFLKDFRNRAVPIDLLHPVQIGVENLVVVILGGKADLHVTRLGEGDLQRLRIVLHPHDGGARIVEQKVDALVQYPAHGRIRFGRDHDIDRGLARRLARLRLLLQRLLREGADDRTCREAAEVVHRLDTVLVPFRHHQGAAGLHVDDKIDVLRTLLVVEEVCVHDVGLAVQHGRKQAGEDALHIFRFEADAFQGRFADLDVTPDELVGALLGIGERRVKRRYGDLHGLSSEGRVLLGGLVGLTCRARRGSHEAKPSDGNQKTHCSSAHLNSPDYDLKGRTRLALSGRNKRVHQYTVRLFYFFVNCRMCVFLVPDMGSGICQNPRRSVDKQKRY
nr:hypothetical protein SHINE37_10343 [Rhizobiaceae bacterium]